MPLRLGGEPLPNVTGLVTSLDVGGNGPNSAILVFTVLVASTGQDVAFGIYSDTLPQVFAAAATLLALAYDKRLAVTVQSVTKEGGAPQAVGVTLPHNGAP